VKQSTAATAPQQRLSAQRLGSDSQSAALPAREPEASAAQLLAQNSVLLEQILDGPLLASIHPAGDGRDAKLEDEIVHGRQATAVAASVERSAKSSTNPASLGSAQYPDRTGSNDGTITAHLLVDVPRTDTRGSREMRARPPWGFGGVSSPPQVG